jgi:hypothetical protein
VNLREYVEEAMSIYPSDLLTAGVFQVGNGWKYFDES